MEPSTYLLQALQLVGYGIVATVFVMLIRGRVEGIKIKIDGIEDQLDSLKLVAAGLQELRTQIAVTNIKIIAIEEDIRELRHGRGFIKSSIDGEYDDKGKLR